MAWRFPGRMCTHGSSCGRVRLSPPGRCLKSSGCRHDRAVETPWQHCLEHHLPRFVAGRNAPAVRADELIDDVQAKAQALARSEEHTSELQSQSNLVCRLLLEKKK